MEQYSEDFLKYVEDIKKKHEPITIPALDVLFIIYTSEKNNIQDEKPTNKKSKK
jgi:hypothetical protein